MIALCVDDEELVLSALVRAVKASPDVTEVVSFRYCDEALAWAETNMLDVAFLDVQLRGCTGLQLAERLRAIHPQLPIIFCTGYCDYALDALRLHASGYLMKPVREEDVQKELDALLCMRPGLGALLQVRCFGEFEALKDGKPLLFSRKKTKELLALLVDRRGAALTAHEIVAYIWEGDDADEKKKMQYLHQLLADLRNSLRRVGAEGVLVKGTQEYAIDVNRIDCDYYRYLRGDPAAVRLFTGEYMTRYSWAEPTMAHLLRNFR